MFSGWHGRARCCTCTNGHVQHEHSHHSQETTLERESSKRATSSVVAWRRASCPASAEVYRHETGVAPDRMDNCRHMAAPSRDDHRCTKVALRHPKLAAIAAQIVSAASAICKSGRKNLPARAVARLYASPRLG